MTPLRFLVSAFLGVLVTLALARHADAQRLVLVEPSGSLEAAVRRSLVETSLDLVNVKGSTSPPRDVGKELDARFVVWREGSAYVLWDAATRRVQRRAVTGLEDELTATALADDIVAWIVASEDIAIPAEVEQDQLRRLLATEPASPRFRIELSMGTRHNVAARYPVAFTTMFAFLWRVGPVEIGPEMLTVERVMRWNPMTYTTQAEWQENAYLVHVRRPVDGITGKGGTLIPRIGAGALVVHASTRAGAPPVLMRAVGVFPVAEVGLTFELRRHRVTFGVDGAAMMHLQQSFDEDLANLEIASHLEASVLARFGILLY